VHLITTCYTLAVAVKTKFSHKEFSNILSNYDLGKLVFSKVIREGTVQTNYILVTTKEKIIFRYYENRQIKSVLFEAELIKFLTKNNYPCPDIFRDKHEKLVGIYQGKPFALFEFIEGEHINNPSETQWKQLIKYVAQLHALTRSYIPKYCQNRWNYTPELCKKLAKKKAKKIGTKTANEKLEWLKKELLTLHLPNSHPKGICHCDFDFSNILYKGEEFVGLIDFDDANYTYLTFDLVDLLERGAWRRSDKHLNLKRARSIITDYSIYRQLSDIEKEHLFDVYKLSILFDSLWFFERSAAGDFYEKKKIDFMNKVGRDEFYNMVFG